jgi:hypothetical protein
VPPPTTSTSARASRGSVRASSWMVPVSAKPQGLSSRGSSARQYFPPSFPNQPSIGR